MSCLSEPEWNDIGPLQIELNFLRNRCTARLHLNGYSCNLLISCQVNKVNSPVSSSILHRRQKGCA